MAAALAQGPRAGGIADGRCTAGSWGGGVRHDLRSELLVVGAAAGVQRGRVAVVPGSLNRETAWMPDDHTEHLTDVARSLQRAMNEHDVEAFVSLFAEDYDSQAPAHPDRAFRGREQVRTNWTAIFSGVPDFRAVLIATAESEESLWTEWHWDGTHADGSQLQMGGVIVMGIRDGLIAWGRLYVEPVEQTGAGIDAAVSKMSGND